MPAEKTSESRHWGQTTNNWSASHALFNPFHTKTAQKADKPLYTAQAHTNIFGQSNYQVTTSQKAFAEYLSDYSFSETPSLNKQLIRTLTDYHVQLLEEEQNGRTTSLAKKKSLILKNTDLNLEDLAQRKAAYLNHLKNPSQETKDAFKLASKTLGLIDKLEALKEWELSVYDIKNETEQRDAKANLRQRCVKEIVEALKQNGKLTKAFWFTDGRLYKVLRNAQYVAKQYQFTARKIYQEDQGIFKENKEYGLNSALAVSSVHDVEQALKKQKDEKEKKKTTTAYPPIIGSVEIIDSVENGQTKKPTDSMSNCATEEITPVGPTDEEQEDVALADYAMAKPYAGGHALYLAQAKRLALATSATEHSAAIKPLLVVNQISRPFDKVANYFKHFFKKHTLPAGEVPSEKRREYDERPYQHLATTLDQGEGLWFAIKQFGRVTAAVTAFSALALGKGIVQGLIILPAWFWGHLVDVFQDFPEGWIGQLLKKYSPGDYKEILLRHDKRLSTEAHAAKQTVAHQAEAGPATTFTWLHAKQPYSPQSMHDASLLFYTVKWAEYLTLATVDWLWQNPITTMVAGTLGGLGYAACTNPSWPLHQKMIDFGNYFFSSQSEAIFWSASTAGQVGVMGVNLIENPEESYTWQLIKIVAQYPLQLAAIAGISYGLGFALGHLEFLSEAFGTKPIVAQTYLGAKSTTVLVETAIEREKSLVGKILIFPFMFIIGFARLFTALIGLGSIERETLNLVVSLFRAAQVAAEGIVTTIYVGVYVTAAAVLFPFSALPKLLAKIFGWIPGVNKVCDYLIDLQFNAEQLFENITGSVFAWKENMLAPLENMLFNFELNQAVAFLTNRDLKRDKARLDLGLEKVSRVPGSLIENSEYITPDSLIKLEASESTDTLQSQKEMRFAARMGEKQSVSGILTAPKTDNWANMRLGFTHLITGKDAKQFDVPKSNLKLKS